MQANLFKTKRIATGQPGIKLQHPQLLPNRARITYPSCQLRFEPPKNKLPRTGHLPIPLRRMFPMLQSKNNYQRFINTNVEPHPHISQPENALFMLVFCYALGDC